MINVHAETDEPMGSYGRLIPQWSTRGILDVPLEPGIAAVTLYPGQHIGVLDNMLYSHEAGEKIGIVDPFLSGPVQPGERFWVWVYPDTVQVSWKMNNRKPKAFTVISTPEDKPFEPRKPIAKPTKSS